MVILILVAVVLGLLWGARLSTAAAIGVTAAGWAIAMAIVIATTSGIDAGFWIFNTILLVVGVGLTRVGGRWNHRGTDPTTAHR